MDPLRPLLRHPLWRTAGFSHVRALVLLCHVVVVVVVACPAPLKGGNKTTWEKPGVRAEVRAWQGRLASIGVDVSERALVDLGSDVAARWGRTRNRFVAPLSTYLRDIGAPQGWYMFTAPDRTPQRFGVDVVDADGARRRAFVLGEPSAWPALASDAFLDEHRVRRALFQSAWSDRAAAMREVCGYFGRRALEQDPAVVEVRCFQLQADVIHPWRRHAARQPPREKRTLRLDAASLAQPARTSTKRAKAKASESSPSPPALTTPASSEAP